ncbi:MAG: hypothetical protein ACRCUJ_09070 [Phocaeicola sp.]
MHKYILLFFSLILFTSSKDVATEEINNVSESMQFDNLLLYFIIVLLVIMNCFLWYLLSFKKSSRESIRDEISRLGEEFSKIKTKFQIMYNDSSKTNNLKVKIDQLDVSFNNLKEDYLLREKEKCDTYRTVSEEVLKDMLKGHNSIKMEIPNNESKVAPRYSSIVYAEASLDSANCFTRIGEKIQSMTSVYTITFFEGDSLGKLEVVEDMDVWRRIATNIDEKLKACDLEKRSGELKIETITPGVVEKLEGGKYKLKENAKVVFYSN